jgi:hypothetical protein
MSASLLEILREIPDHRRRSDFADVAAALRLLAAVKIRA